MPGHVLNMNSSIMCPHGGQVICITTNTKVFADGSQALLESDIHPVAGCPFTIGLKYSPCVRVEWEAGTGKVKIDNTPVLVRSSIGKCINAEGAIQGVAVIAATQMKVSGI